MLSVHAAFAAEADELGVAAATDAFTAGAVAATGVGAGVETRVVFGVEDEVAAAAGLVSGALTDFDAGAAVGAAELLTMRLI